MKSAYQRSLVWWLKLACNILAYLFINKIVGLDIFCKAHLVLFLGESVRNGFKLPFKSLFVISLQRR